MGVKMDLELDWIEPASRERIVSLGLAMRWSPLQLEHPNFWKATFERADLIRGYVFGDASFVPAPGPRPGSSEHWATSAGAQEPAVAQDRKKRGRKPRQSRTSAALVEPKRRGRRKAADEGAETVAAKDERPKRMGRPPKQGEFTAEQIRLARGIINAGAHNNVLLAQKMGLTADVAKRLWTVATEAE